MMNSVAFKYGQFYYCFVNNNQ